METLPAEENSVDGGWRLPVTDADRALLAAHLVHGRPAFSATMLLDHAAKAAGRLVPGLRVLRVTDAVFRCFTRVRADGSLPPLWVRARTLPELTADEVRVHVTIGVLPPGQSARGNMDVVVHLGHLHPMPAPVLPTPVTGARPVVDPFHVPGSPVSLSRPFVALEHPVTAEGAVTARYVPAFPNPEDLRGHVLPVIALDCLLRATALAQTVGDRLPIAVPTGIPRIDFHIGANDLALPRSAAPLVLSHDTASGSARLTDPATDRVLVTVHGAALHPLCWWRLGTGEFSETEEM